MGSSVEAIIVEAHFSVRPYARRIRSLLAEVGIAITGMRGCEVVTGRGFRGKAPRIIAVLGSKNSREPSCHRSIIRTA